jgi:adenylate cyclase
LAGRLAKLDRRAFVVCAGLIGVLLALGLWRLGWLETWEAKTWDWRSRFLAEKGAASDQIRLILVDQNSLDWGSEGGGGGYPFHRAVALRFRG